MWTSIRITSGPVLLASVLNTSFGEANSPCSGCLAAIKQFHSVARRRRLSSTSQRLMGDAIAAGAKFTLKFIPVGAFHR